MKVLLHHSDDDEEEKNGLHFGSSFRRYLYHSRVQVTHFLTPFCTSHPLVLPVFADIMQTMTEKTPG